MLNTNPLLEAIERYLTKSNEDLETELADEGFVSADVAVASINEIEEAITEALESNADSLLEKLSTAESVKIFLEEIWPDMQNEDDLTDILKDIFRKQFTSVFSEFTYNWIIYDVPDLAEAFSEDQRITLPMQTFIDSWSKELAELMHLSTLEKIKNILSRTQDEELSIEEVTDLISESGIRNAGYRARRVALTETLRLESYSHLESMQQNPLAYKKKWVHTNRQKGKPRENHVAISGQEKFKNQPFELDGYFPMCPRDTCLPPSESINCHCIMETIANETAVGMTKEELQDLRKQTMDKIDEEWKARMEKEEGLRYASTETISQYFQSLNEEE